MHPRQQIYLDFEPHFVYDYIFFAAHLRFLQSQENSYKNYQMHQMAKAMCLVNLFEIYLKSLEDLAAVMLAFYRRYNTVGNCPYQGEFGETNTPLNYTLINYKPGEAKLKDLLNLFTLEIDIINKLGIKNLEKVNITLLYPDINLGKAYRFFLDGLKSLRDDQDKRLLMFNKIKHGGVVVGDGHYYSNSLPLNSPAALYANQKAYSENDHPLTIHGFKFSEDEFILMKSGVMKVSVMIKILLALYLCAEYRDTLTSKGLKTSLAILSKIKMKQSLSLWHGY